MPGKIKIVSDGFGCNTHILDTDGKEIKWGESDPLALSISVEPDDVVRVTLDLVHCDISMFADIQDVNDHTFNSEGNLVRLERKIIIDRDSGKEYTVLVPEE